MEKTSSEKKRRKKKNAPFHLFSLCTLFFTSVDHIDTLTAFLLLEFVDLRDCYFVLILAYLQVFLLPYAQSSWVSGIESIASRDEIHSIDCVQKKKSTLNIAKQGYSVPAAKESSISISPYSLSVQ